jgi:hypothetical protein
MTRSRMRTNQWLERFRTKPQDIRAPPSPRLNCGFRTHPNTSTYRWWAPRPIPRLPYHPTLPSQRTRLPPPRHRPFQRHPFSLNRHLSLPIPPCVPLRPHLRPRPYLLRPPANSHQPHPRRFFHHHPAPLPSHCLSSGLFNFQATRASRRHRPGQQWRVKVQGMSRHGRPGLPHHPCRTYRLPQAALNAFAALHLFFFFKIVSLTLHWSDGPMPIRQQSFGAASALCVCSSSRAPSHWDAHAFHASRMDPLTTNPTHQGSSRNTMVTLGPFDEGSPQHTGHAQQAHGQQAMRTGRTSRSVSPLLSATTSPWGVPIDVAASETAARHAIGV